jgi:hypothetical protein
MAKGAVPFSRFCEKGTVPFAAAEAATTDALNTHRIGSKEEAR